MADWVHKQEDTHVTQYGLSLDKMGRWAVAGDAFWNFSGTPGPYIATLIVTYGGFASLGVWAFTSGAIGMALFRYAAKRSDALGLEE